MMYAKWHLCGVKTQYAEWFVLEGTLKIILFQPPCHGQGHLDQVTQSPNQSGLEHFQREGIHSFPVQPVPVSEHPHSKDFLHSI